MREPRCSLAYDIDTRVGSYTVADLKRLNLGGTDAIYMATLDFPPDGTMRLRQFTMDGRFPVDGQAGKMPSEDLYKLWAMLTLHLSKDPSLDEAKRGYAGEVWEDLRQATLDGRPFLIQGRIKEERK